MTSETKMKCVKVVVLGDIGRSPRMQYHALSLANNGLKVNVIGYLDSTPLPDILANEYITVTKLTPLKFDKGPKLVQYAFKAIWQSLSLLLTLFLTGKCDYLLCQNPPAIPTLPICRFYCLITRCKFIIDFHNYAYSIMAMSLPADHILLKVSKAIEMFFASSSDYNLCVTHSMKQDLSANWGVEAKTLYDRPPNIFKPMTLEEKHDWFVKLSQQYPEFSNTKNMPTGDQATDNTAFTQVVGGNVESKLNRPGLLFSSTSWTQDEDFGILMEALQVYETTLQMTNKLPKLICVITGKGPMKEYYIKKIAERKWRHIQVVTPWLEAEDYPKMVACADLGVCLHTSSSGLDLPMKVVDMFGAGLPVCACYFQCIHELVKKNVNGYIFHGSDELAKQIIRWFKEFPNNKEQNEIAAGMRSQLEIFQKSRWEDNWNLRVQSFFA